MDNLDLLRTAREIIESMHYPNVEGTCIGFKFRDGKKTEELAVVVYVGRKLAEAQLEAWQVIPRAVSVSGQEVETDVVQSKFKALTLIDKDSGVIKPGYSIGHPNITAATLGFFANRRSQIHVTTSAICLVSCAHAIGDTNKGKIGDPVYYPGPYDGGTEKNIVAYLAASIPIEMIEGQCPIANFCVNALNFLAKLARSKHRVPKPIREVTNRVDCAAAWIAEGIEIDKNIFRIGIPVGIEQATLGMKVQKSGRTTEYTEGEIIGIEARVTVGYQEGTALFVGQTISDIPSAGGDSGSAVLTYGNNLVGLLFAGGEGITIMNPIEDVFQQLELDILGK